MAKFGEIFRRHREQAGVSMGAVAEHLGVSVPYVSDVELGRRSPFTPERIARACVFLRISNPEQLLRAAAESRGAFELNAQVSAKAQRVGASLMRNWTELSPEQLEQIEQVLNKNKGEGP